MKEIILDDHEMLMVKIVGLWRQHANISAGVLDRKHDMKRSGEDIHMDGFMAEYAFGKWKNLFVDLSTKMRASGFDIQDKNFRFDIKATRYDPPYLKVTKKFNPDVDIYVLAQIKGNAVRFIGWEYKDNVIQDKNLKDLGTGGGYVLKPEDLKPI